MYKIALFLAVISLMACSSTKKIAESIPTTPVVADFFKMQRKDINIVKSTVSQHEIKSHIQFLASDELRGRNMPSPELKIAAEYLKTQMMFFGVDTIAGHGGYKQSVYLDNEQPPSSGTFKIKNNSLNFGKEFIIVKGENGDLTGPTVFAKSGMGNDIASLDVKDKIVISYCGDGESQSPQAWFGMAKDKREALEAKGAKAIVEIYQSAQIPWSFLTRQLTRAQMKLGEAEKETNSIPHLWVSTQDSMVIKDLVAGNQNATLSIKGMVSEKIESYNVIGYVEGTDPALKDEYIIYSAHYDHVGVGTPDATQDSIYNGTRDNAIGTTAVLTAAQNIAANPTKRSSLFILWTGEEKGLLGSAYFVDHSPVPLDKIAYCFNIDNGGYNDTSIVTVIGLTRTTVEPHMQVACNAFGLDAIEDPAKEQGLFDRSDNVNFAKKGVPAPTFSLGFRAFDDEIMKYYHQAGDEIETVDMDYVTKYCKAFVLAGRLIADDPKKPFWNEGDKYYEVGKTLYGKVSN